MTPFQSLVYLGISPLKTQVDLRRTPNQPLETELGILFAFELPFEGVIGRITAGDERDHAIRVERCVSSSTTSTSAPMHITMASHGSTGKPGAR